MTYFTFPSKSFSASEDFLYHETAVLAYFLPYLLKLFVFEVVSCF